MVWEKLAQKYWNYYLKGTGSIPHSLYFFCLIFINMPEFVLTGEIWICQALVDSGLVPSTSQARRDITSGAVKINQEKVTDDKLNLTAGEYILQKGKKSFAKMIIN